MSMGCLVRQVRCVCLLAAVCVCVCVCEREESACTTCCVLLPHAYHIHCSSILHLLLIFLPAPAADLATSGGHAAPSDTLTLVGVWLHKLLRRVGDGCPIAPLPGVAMWLSFNSEVIRNTPHHPEQGGVLLSVKAEQTHSMNAIQVEL